MSYFQITLLVTTEQDHAIYELFREKGWIYIKTGHVQADDTQLCEIDPKVNRGMINTEQFDTEEYVSNIEQRINIGNTSLQSNDDTLHSENEADEMKENIHMIVKTEPFTSEALIGDKVNESGCKDEVSVVKNLNKESQADTECFASQSSPKSSNIVKTSPEKVQSITPKKQKLIHTEKQKQASVKITLLKDKHHRKHMLRGKTYLSKKKTNDNDSEMQVKRKKLQTILYGDKGSRSKHRIHCDDCQKTFTGRRRYENHLIDGKCHFDCEFCGKVFHHRNKTSYEVHLKMHRNELDFHCEECGMSFVTKFNLDRHQQGRHATDRPHRCDKCSYRFHTKASLFRHIERTHYEGNGIHCCPTCSKTFSLPSQLLIHLEKTHLEPDIPCSVCGKLFRPGSISRHEASHKDGKNFKCDHCSAAFKFKAELVAHKKRHIKEYSDYCETCGKGFYGSNPLMIHRRVHTGEKPYACELCEYRCALKGNLKLHMKVHEKLSI